MLWSYFKIAFKNLRVRPLRTWLTILGIVIGVFLIFSLLSLSEGLKDAIMSELRMMGGNLIFVMPGDMGDMLTTFIGGMEISNSDIDAIARAPGVDKVIAMPWSAEVVRYKDSSKMVLMVGSDWRESLEVFQTDMGWNLTSGTWPIPGRPELIVGSLVPIDIFKGLEAGDRLNVKGRPFNVAGVLRSIGSKQDDMMIYMDLDNFYSITGKREGAQAVMVKVADNWPVDEVADNIRFELEETRRRRRDDDAPSFSILTSDAASDMVGNVMGIIQLAIVGFASIALLVGGIGIMNTMYTSVYERIREIGILKAIGARKSSIVAIFLIESGIIGLIGGIGGIVLGIGMAKILEIYADIHPMFYIRASITPGLVLFGLAFSFGVGCASGYFPARHAANFKPVDALRYE